MENSRMQSLAASIGVLCAASLWGAIGVSVRYISGFGVTSLQNAWFRISVTTAVLFIYILITDRSRFSIKIQDLKLFFGSGVCSILLNNVAYAISVQVNTLSTAAILLYTAPFIVIVLAHIFLHERLTARKVAALVICFVGCILVVGLGIFKENILSPVGVLAGLGSAFGYALYNIFTKLLVKRYHTLTVVFYTFLFAFAGVLCVAHPIKGMKLIAAMPERIPAAVLSAILTSAVPYLIFPMVLRYVESSKASIMSTFEVAASSILGVILYHENLSIINIIGILMILAGNCSMMISRKTLFVNAGHRKPEKTIDN